MLLEELRLKVDLGVMSKEQAAAELARLPELTRTKVKFLSHQSVYERWEDMQERLAEERRQEESGSEDGTEAEGETVRE